MPTLPTNDYHRLPVSEKQLRYARSIATRAAVDLPRDVMEDRRALSAWIERHKTPVSRFDAYPSSKQVAFAERIAQIKRQEIPHECFRDKSMMSRWIDSNK
jgi:hypothetical protein